MNTSNKAFAARFEDMQDDVSDIRDRNFQQRYNAQRRTTLAAPP